MKCWLPSPSLFSCFSPGHRPPPWHRSSMDRSSATSPMNGIGRAWRLGHDHAKRDGRVPRAVTDSVGA